MHSPSRDQNVKAKIATPPQQAWIDAGGTFTDCYVTATENEHDWLSSIRSGKILSSGRVPIHLEPTHNFKSFISPQLAQDPDDFWRGAELVAISPQGEELTRELVDGFQSDSNGGQLELARPLTSSLWSKAGRMELSADLHAPVLGIRRLLRCPLTQSLPPLSIRLGTTRGTNALLTRRGAKTAFAITAPFRDLLRIGDQTRDDLFALTVRKSSPLPDRIVEIHERLDTRGQVLVPIDLEAARKTLASCLQAGCTSLAICLMHSYANAEHEQMLASLARELGFAHISVSSNLASVMEFVARAETTAVDAYLSPVIRDYLREIRQQFDCHLAQATSGNFTVQSNATASVQELLVMTSAGGLVDWEHFHGKDSILSGPAGGICALNALRKAVSSDSVEALIGLDMGGTSTDVSRVSETPVVEYESTKAGVRILTPTLPIETVAAGGGSICWFDGVSLRVGPDSAGASPGPACYGQGGPLTVTDLNVFLGRIPDAQFPFPVHHPAIQHRLEALLHQVTPTLQFDSAISLAKGLRTLANEQMAEAVRSVTIAQGSDPRSHALVGFGGAAGQHICEIASLLDVSTVFDSSEAGKLSALGMGFADQRADAVHPVYQPIDELHWDELDDQIVESAAALTMSHSNTSSTGRKTEIWFELRYVGTDATLRLLLDSASTIASVLATELSQRFHLAHEKRFGYRHDKQVELVSVRLESTLTSAFELPECQRVRPARDRDFTHGQQTRGTGDYPFVPRKTIVPGDRFRGPCGVSNQGSTLVVEADWQAEVLSDGTLRLERMQTHDVSRVESRTTSRNPEFDPVFRECFAARLSAIASQMGIVLQQTAASVNVKQRRDFSCAIFDKRGNLLANAPHVPVHLGAMGQTVRETLKQFPEMSQGQSFITNDPYCGGSHLPDVTVVTPIFDASHQPQLQMLVANRAHHADMGGIAPGSMSIHATKLGQEGVIIPLMQIAKDGKLTPEDLLDLFRTNAHPPRNVEQNVADIHAQLAANLRGVELLQGFAANETWFKLDRYAEYLLAMAQQHLQNFAASLDPTACYRFADQLEEGTAIAVEISVQPSENLKIDFAGSGHESATNFNANPSIVTAAVLYVLRLLMKTDMPLNEGAMRAIQLQVPKGILRPSMANAPELRPAVAAGNVETSQRIVDVLLGAFQVAGASQGTMNNVLFGNQDFGFYETICGGSGATQDGDGASAVHTHMTNTRLTDPEVLEHNYPVRLREFGIRSHSGGEGRHRGGDGVVREFEFLDKVTLSLLTSRRSTRPYGVLGGQSGLPGKNTLIRLNLVDEQIAEELPACCSLEVQAGDRLRLETPGGGGYGAAEAPVEES